MMPDATDNELHPDDPSCVGDILLLGPARSMILIAAAYVTQITLQNPNQPWRWRIAVGTRLARHAQGLPSTGCRPVTPMCAARCSGMSCAGGRECQTCSLQSNT